MRANEVGSKLNGIRGVPIMFIDENGGGRRFSTGSKFQRFIRSSSSRNGCVRSIIVSNQDHSCYYCNRFVAADACAVFRMNERHKAHLSCLRRSGDCHEWKVQEYCGGTKHQYRICYYCKNLILRDRFNYKPNYFYNACKKCVPDHKDWKLVQES